MIKCKKKDNYSLLFIRENFSLLFFIVEKNFTFVLWKKKDITLDNGQKEKSRIK